MKIYADYIFYIDKYMGEMPQEDFEKLVIRASAEVRKNIFDRDISGYEEEVKMATCSVADILSKIQKLEQRMDKLISNDKGDKIVASESVADLSRTFANTTNISDLEKEIVNQNSKISEAIRLYLIDTGLLYRGV